MRRGFIGIISVLVLLLLVGGCGDDEAGPVAQVSALTAIGVMYPGTVTISSEGDFDDEAWTNPGDVMANDGNYASANFAGSGANKETWVLRATNFGFAVPTGATIDGISVEIERYESVKYSLQDALVQPTKNGTTRVGDNKADTATYWTTSLGIRQYGNATDLWGTNWTAAEINAPTFGVHFAVRKPGSGSGRVAYVDFIRITVYYSANSAPVAHNQTGLSVNSCSTLTVTLNGTDPDGDPLTYKISTLPGHGDLYDGTGTGGTKIASVPYAVTDGTHKVTYQPTSSYSGGDSFGFKVNDGKVDSAEATIFITVSDGRSWWYQDSDGDNYGNATVSQQACSSPVGYVADNTDCDDTNAAVNPGATEVCNGMDDDCDGSTDEGCKYWYQDNDGDNCGNPAVSQQSASQPPGYVADNTDCDDNDGTVYPGAPELCDGKDNDCNTLVDDGAGSLWYEDNDVDGYGNSTVSQQACSAPAGYVADNADCDDNDGTVYPGAPELSDGKDNDCDGNTDERYYYPVTGPIPLPHILLTYSTRGGAVTDPGEGVYYMLGPSSVVNLTATPDAGYRFVGWTGGPDIIADVGAASTTVIMNRDCAIEANFAEILEPLEIGQYNLTTSSTAGGSVSVPGEETFTYGAGTVADLVAKADSGYKFDHWSGDVTTVANVNGATTTIAMNGDYSIVANFAEIPPGQAILTISSSPGGSVTTPGEATFTYDEGTVVSLEAGPEESCRFLGWIGDADDVADVTAACTAITMNDNYSITAVFKFGTGCFIATAAYGTSMAEEIQILRDFRDEYLLTNPVGKTLVGLYYMVSPPIADFITEHPGLKPIVRVGLAPAVAMSTVAVNTTPTEKIAMLSLTVLFSVALAIWATRRRGKSPQYV